MEGLRPGLKNKIIRIVRGEHTAKFLGSGGVNVLATPMMITWMEECARLLADKHLGEGKTTVGTRVDIQHKAPAPVGARVTVEAELVSVEGRRLVFKVRAYSGSVVIGEGIHERYIIDLDRFKKKVQELMSKLEIEEA